VYVSPLVTARLTMRKPGPIRGRACQGASIARKSVWDRREFLGEFQFVLVSKMDTWHELQVVVVISIDNHNPLEQNSDASYCRNI